MLNKLIKLIKKYNYADKVRYKLLAIDSYADFKDLQGSINFFNDEHAYNKTKIYFSYLLEKFIVFNTVAGKRTIENNKIFKIFNLTNQLGLGTYTKELTLEKLSFLIDYEQIRFQYDNNKNLQYRYLKLFSNNDTTKEIINLVLKMSLDKFIVLSLSFVLFIRNSKKVSIKFDIEKFKYFILKGQNSFTKNDINNFIQYISIDKQSFIKKYYTIRKINFNDDEEILSDELLKEVDRYLPKVSFYYPIIIENNNYYISSYTAIIEFLKLERVFTEISENKDIDKNYRSDILGKKLIEEYVKNEANVFQEKYKIDLKIHGGQVYNVSKNKFDEPDCILETSNYIIFIECKNSISHLIKSIQNFDDKIKNRISNDLKTSDDNINRYLQNHTSAANKKIYKFLMYFNVTPISIANLKFNLFPKNDFILTDIGSVELLFRTDCKDLSQIINEYENQHNDDPLYDFLFYNYNVSNDNIDYELDKIKKDILKRQFFKRGN